MFVAEAMSDFGGSLPEKTLVSAVVIRLRRRRRRSIIAPAATSTTKPPTAEPTMTATLTFFLGAAEGLGDGGGWMVVWLQPILTSFGGSLLRFVFDREKVCGLVE